MSKELMKTAGDIYKELEDASLETIYGGVETKKISKGNDGKWCTLTWECSICPTKTCFTC
ncbi:plantaricin C family lantibiotic [Lysinibacillus sp. M3]|uniref:Plantaricin C family lantibiotic n=1 Tax=Lysinibacillus zambalensis TaxID=3160866 RepID=A0ABV1MQJ9_9BACI